MVQVRPSSHVCVFRADLTCLQLAASSRLVSSRGLHCLLRHPCRLVYHHIQRLRHQSGASNRPRRLSTPLARPNGLPARLLDTARSFRLCARSRRCRIISHRMRRPRQRLRCPDCSRLPLTPLAPPSPILGLSPDMVRPFCRRSESTRLNSSHRP